MEGEGNTSPILRRKLMKKYIALACILTVMFVGIPLVRAGTITETGMSQRDLVRYLTNISTIVNELKADYNLARYQLLNRSFTSGVLSSSGAVATAKTTATINYTIDGNLYSFAASSNMYITPTAAQSTPTYCYYLFSLNSSGAVTVTKGTEAAGTASLTLPGVPDGTTPFGAVLVYASSTAFTMGTSNLNTAVIAAPTWYNLSTVNSGASAATSISTSDLSLVNP